jgi:hypothetical protein
MTQTTHSTPATEQQAVRRPLAAAIAVAALTLVGAGYDGWIEHRWDAPADPRAAALRLRAVPQRLGEWEVESTEALEPSIVKMLQCSGYLNRIYRHRSTGERLHVAVLAGPAGPISVHTPDVCYSNRNYQMAGGAERLQVRPDDRPKEAFWNAMLRHADRPEETLEVVYAWNGGDGWQAPSQPRFALGGRPLLYKLQIARNVRPGHANETETCRSFLVGLLPALDQELFGL